MRALVYLRQSLDRSGLGAAVDRQREDCEKLCAQRGWTVVREFKDNDTSASSKKPRPQYQAMLAAVERGEADVMVAWHVDRLTRKITDLEHLIELAQKTGVRIATATGDLDLSTDSGRLVGRILASVARGEVERKGARQSRAQQQAAQQGRPAGGRRAFGYAVDSLALVEAEAREVRAAYRTILEGGTLRAIAADWNTRGVTTTAGGKWVHSTVRRMLKNPRYAGKRTYRGEVVGAAQWPAVVDDDTFTATHALLSMPERRTTTGTARLYLLPGLALCHCGSPVTTGRTQHGIRTYRCRDQRGHMSRAAEPIDALIAGGEMDGEHVRGYVVERLSKPDAAELLRDNDRPDVGAHRARAAAIQQRLDDLATALADGLLTLPAVRQASDRLKRELADVEARIATVTAADVLAPLVNARDVESAWHALDLDRKRAVINELMTVTLLKPLRGRRRFDPETVDVLWKSSQHSESFIHV